MPINLWGTTGTFQVLVDSWNDSREFIHNEIITVEGHNGNPRRVMQSTIFKDQHEWTQNPYVFLDAVEDGDFYISCWLIFLDNLGEVLGEGTDDGRFWWAVNGEVIADYHGPNNTIHRLFWKISPHSMG